MPSNQCKCMSFGCPKMARWQISVRTWPRAVQPRTMHNCFEALTGAAVCDEHAIRDPDSFLTPKAKQIIAAAMKAANRGEPDFDYLHIIHNEIMGDNLITVADALRLGGTADPLQ